MLPDVWSCFVDIMGLFIYWERKQGKTEKRFAWPSVLVSALVILDGERIRFRQADREIESEWKRELMLKRRLTRVLEVLTEVEMSRGRG